MERRLAALPNPVRRKGCQRLLQSHCCPCPDQDAVSPKSKVLKAYGMSTSRSLQPHESDGVLSIQQIFSSPERLEISSSAPQKNSIRKKPASKKKAEKKATPSLGPEELEKIQKIIQENKATVVLHRLRMASASKPERSYVTSCFCSDNQHKQPLLVEFSQKAFPDVHKDLAKKTLKKIVDRQMTFNQAREQKHDLAK